MRRRVGRRIFDGRLPLLLLGMAVLAVALLNEPVEPWLRYQRQAVLEGQVWRLLSAHLVHLNGPHLGMNLAGLVLLYLYVGNGLGWRWLVASLLVSALTVGLGLLWLSPGLAWYVGLSGVLHGALATAALGRVGHRDGRLLLALLAVKLAWEQGWGALPGSQGLIQEPVVVEAHLYGALGGVWVGLSMIGTGCFRRWG